jgi:hypothetical protein
MPEDRHHRRDSTCAAAESGNEPVGLFASLETARPYNYTGSQYGVVGTMQSSDLNRRQVAILRKRIADFAGYLAKVRQRMDANRFPPMDPLRVDIIAAQGRMKCLLSELDYLAMQLGAMKPSEASKRQPQQDRIEDIF